MTTDFVVLVTGSRDLVNPDIVYITLDDCLSFALNEGFTRLCVRHGATGCADLAKKSGIKTHRVELWKES